MKKLVMIVALCLVPMVALAGNPAETFIRELEGRILAVIKDEAINDDVKQEKLEALFDEVVDVEWIGRFVLGKYWRKASEEQQKDFVATYTEFLKKTYVSNFKKYDGERVEVQDSRDEGKGKYFVKTSVLRKDAKPLDVGYKVKSNRGHMQIFDIQVEGVSLLNTQREEFTTVVSREGLDSLIGKMKFRLKNL